jgi:YHS domain-containing protein
MSKNIRSIVLMAALAVILVVGVVAQQKSADTAVDPVCGMTVVKANAKATFDYKGATYYFCSTGCKEAFAKEPEKYLSAMKAKTAGAAAAPAAGMGMMHGGQGMGQGMAGCPMCGGQGMTHGEMGMGMHGGMGMRGRGMMPPPGMGILFRLYGDKIEMAVENTKDGAVLKVTSKDPEVVKAIQVHMAEHMAMMKKMRENAAKAPAAGTGVKAPGESACADCQMIKK